LTKSFSAGMLAQNGGLMIAKPTRYFWIVLLALLTACGQVPPQTTPTATLTPLPPTMTSVPTITSTPELRASEPPACTFPLAGTTIEESKPETYTFSEPRVVLSAPNSMLSISEWLPDSQRVLIKRSIVEKTYYDSVELFNPVEVKTQVYAEIKQVYGLPIWGLPVWVSGLDSALYQEFEIDHFRYNANGNYIPPASETINMLLLLSSGNPDNVQQIEDSPYAYSPEKRDWVLSSIAVKPDGSEIVYLKAKDGTYQFFRREILQGQLSEGQSLPIGRDMLKNYTVMRYKMTWRPYTEQVFFAGNDDVGNDQSFLLDINTGKFCVLDFKTSKQIRLQWVSEAHWSPNGRYLAIVRMVGGYPDSFTDLFIMDMVTGDSYTLAFSPDVKGRHFVGDIAWAPDNYHLVAIGKTVAFPHCAPNCMDDVNRLYLVDFISGKADLIFPSFQVSGGDPGGNLAWSPDGTKIIARCSTKGIGKLCLIPVHIGGD
jgi:WD40 repeat protein